MIDWIELVTTHEAMIWRTVFRLLNNREDALDCCQQVLLEAYEYSQNRKVADWGRFLRVLGTRRAIDGIRQRRKRMIAIQDLAEPVSYENCPVQSAEASELMDRLRIALIELPGKQAEVFWLSCIEGLSHDEIAQHMAITSNESRVSVHRARARLTSLLGETQSISEPKHD